MSRVFVVGAGPMMDGAARRVTAHAVRTWHFVTALRRAGHEVALYTFSQNISPADPEERMVERRARDGFAYENLDMRMGNTLGYLAGQCETFRPDCVVGVSPEPASWACRMRPTVPVWADLHGWVMAEAQLKAARDGSDEILRYFWRQERPVLRRADRISAVSDAQRFAVLGELATVGRLNRHNARYELVVTIPSSADPASVAHPAVPIRIPNLADQESAFVVLWNGGFNTWSDGDTLFEALEWAMEREPAVHFVATGGPIPGHADSVFDAFRARVDASPHRSRYHLLGWVPAEDFPGYLAAGHLAMCVDYPCVETSTGTRTRLLEAMVAGLPVLMTRGTELSGAVEAGGAGWVTAAGDPQALGETIVEAARDREETASLGRHARAFVEQKFAIETTLAPVVQWAEEPRFAPDNEIKRRESPTLFEAAVNPLEADARALDDSEENPSPGEGQHERRVSGSNWPRRLWAWLRRR